MTIALAWEVGTKPSRRADEVPAVTDVEAIYRAHGERLWRALFGWTGGDRDLADEAVSESFARLIERADRVVEPVGWLYRTAFRFALAERRRARRGSPQPQHRTEVPTGLLGVIDALRKLSPSQRAAIVLRYEADLTTREIARVMETSEAAVRVHLFRARSKLRVLLGSEESDDA